MAAIRFGGDRVEFSGRRRVSSAERVKRLDCAFESYGDDDRVLVHDAARPCLDKTELARLIDEVGSDDGGGLLAVPLTDTLKRADDGHAAETLQRDAFWCAQTPQMFRFASLRDALSAVRSMASPMNRARSSAMEAFPDSCSARQPTSR